MQIDWVIWYTEVDLRVLFHFKGDWNEGYEVVLVKMALPWSTTLGMLPVLATPLVYAELDVNSNRAVRPLRVKSGGLVFFCSFSVSLSLPSNCLCTPTRCLSGKKSGRPDSNAYCSSVLLPRRLYLHIIAEVYICSFLFPSRSLQLEPCEKIFSCQKNWRKLFCQSFENWELFLKILKAHYLSFIP